MLTLLGVGRIAAWERLPQRGWTSYVKCSSWLKPRRMQRTRLCPVTAFTGPHSASNNPVSTMQVREKVRCYADANADLLVMGTYGAKKEMALGGNMPKDYFEVQSTAAPSGLLPGTARVVTAVRARWARRHP